MIQGTKQFYLTLQFVTWGIIHIVSFKQVIVWIGIEVNRNGFFDSGRQFFLQSFYKLCYPTAAVIVVAIRDEDVVFKAG